MNTSQNQSTYSTTYNGNSPSTTPFPMVSTNPFLNHQQSLHKKSAYGDIIKRNRVQTMYELSQDLLDKQIEVLERKYGGVKARRAAMVIQKAFRRYTLSKKFAAITLMAKNEKTVTRRILTSVDDVPTSPRIDSEHQYETPDFSKQFEPEPIHPPIHRPLPVRSLSLRERRNVSGTASLPRSQSGTPNLPWDNHQHRVSRTPQYYNHVDQKQYNLWKRESCNVKCNGFTRSCQNTCSQLRKVPPEVPKRTSSITSKSVEQRQRNGLTKTNENGSVSSVQSSGSDSSVSADRIICDGSDNCRYSISPVWKR